MREKESRREDMGGKKYNKKKKNPQGEIFSKNNNKHGGMEQKTFSLEDHYFNHQAIVFSGHFSYSNLISFSLTRGTTRFINVSTE